MDWIRSAGIIIFFMGVNENPSAGRQIARAAGTVMFAIIISNLVGLLRQMVVAHGFGTSPDLEAFNAANRVGEVLFNLMAGGALASAFVPTFTGLLVKDQKSTAWRLASGIANLIVIIMIIVCAITAVIAPWLVQNLLAPGFDAEKQQLTVQILRVLLPSVVIFGLSGLVMGILNAHQKFLIPALTPAMYSTGMILGVWLLSPQLGIFGLAWGAVLGSLLHLGLQMPSLLKLQGRYDTVFIPKDSLVLQVGRLMLPRLFGAAIVQLNFWVNTILASFHEGSLNGITYAFQLMLMPQAAIAQSIAIAAMPTFSAQAALDKMDELRNSLAASLRGLILLSVPASIGLMILRKPIVALLYQRGEFTTQSTELVAWALLWYAAGLVGHAMVEVLSRAFYALQDTRTPVMVGATAMALNILFSLLFMRLFESVGWMPHGGLALANSLATALETVGLIILIRRKMQRINARRILSLTWRSLLAGAVMAAALWGWLIISGGLPNWVIALTGIVAGALVYFVIIRILQVEEVGFLLNSIRRRLGLAGEN